MGIGGSESAAPWTASRVPRMSLAKWGGLLRFGRGYSSMKNFIYLASVICGLSWVAHGEEKPKRPVPAAVPVYNPAKQPVVTGEFPVGLVVITFRETAVPADSSQAMKSIETIKGLSQEEYFKIYSNGIAWPKIHAMPSPTASYQAPQFYGYYCEYDYWRNPMGWKDKEEGNRRTDQMNRDALQFASKTYRGPKPLFICYNYVTIQPEEASEEVSKELMAFYQDRSGKADRSRRVKPRRRSAKDQSESTFDPWDYYSPACGWGDPMWPNSKIQINDFSGSAFAHELGHSLGAPDVYHVARHNDGIGNDASLLAYGPTANAFSRFYHHAYIKEKNHPTLKTAGTYTLYPRHIDPKEDEAVGYLIPSNHPHYLYQVEYIHKENDTVGVGPNQEGMLISVVNLGRESFLGSPDYFYVYRPYDAFFRGFGDTQDCLFGRRHRRTEFNLTTEPSSRLPNLLDGGVAFKNIQEHDGTLTFDLVIDRKSITGSAYTQSMLPQIKLDAVRDIQATSLAMACTIKFRGEPLKTSYGFCWSTRKNPTTKDGCYTLAHRECYLGHAINLIPNTTYYVRAFATNGLGIRYSDEEKIVKTLDPKVPPTSIGPLCTDDFPNNPYLFNKYSNESTETSETFVGYSPTCALAQLIAYYRPARFSPSPAGTNPKNEPIDFDNLSWKPGADDFPLRLEEINRFFGTLFEQSRQLGLHSPKPDKDLAKNLVKLSGVHSKPILTTLTADNLEATVALIKQDLLRSRPVLVMFFYDVEGVTNPTRWAIIDGIDSKGLLHVDFPLNTRLFTTAEGVPLEAGYYRPAALMFESYRALVVTSLFYK
jgi:hypothetical protein